MRLHVDERGSASDPVAVVIHSAGLIGAETLDVFGLWDPGFTAVTGHIADRLSGRLVQFAGADHFFMADGPDRAAEVAAFWNANNP
jgi:hypothetical protein